MSFVDDYTLTRSSVFRALLALFIIVTIINLLVFHLVYSDTQAFHRQQLVQRINDDISELKFAANLSHESFQQILSTKQSTLPHFSYRLSEANPFTASVYPLQQFPANNTHVYLGPDYLLEVAVDQTAMDAYRSALVPSIFSGILLPTAAMLGAAFFLTLLVLRRLERVNQAMNRVLCGERQVKLPVSQQHDEFDILAIHLNFMIEQMAKKEAALKSLTTGLAHDMRTPMARLKLRLEDTLTNSQLTNDQQQAISACHDELEIILSLFNSMLEIAKLNSNETAIVTQTVNLGEVARDAIDFMQPIAQQKHQTLQLRQDQPCVLSGDRSLLFRAVFNLIENAVKYTPEYGDIEVVVDGFGVVVADSGIGISDQDKLHVCKPMFRADKSRTEQGNGLGLSLVDAVVKRHHGHLVLRDNQPGLRARLLFYASGN